MNSISKAEKTKKAMREKALAGESMGALPLGYERVREIRLVNKVSGLIRDAVDQRLNHGYSYERITQFFVRNGVSMTSKRCRRMLLNRYYAGQIKIAGIGYVQGKQEAIITLDEHFLLVKKDQETNGI